MVLLEGVVRYQRKSGATGRRTGSLPDIEHTTVRAAAKKFGISKSTVHKDISERLPLYNRPLWLQVKALLDENKAQRHIRGGLATRRKYKGI